MTVQLRSVLRESALPSDLFSRVVLAVVLLRSPVVWLTSWLLRREPLSVTAIYRPGGDIQYFELVASLSRGNLGESNVYEAAGQGIHPFPLASITLHSVCFAALGLIGLLLADVLASYAYFVALSFCARVFVIPARWAAALAGAVCTNLFVALWPLTDRLGWGRDLIWGDRFPRPLLTETFFLFTVSAAGALWASPERRRSGLFWIGAGLAYSFTAQSDVYNLFIVSLVLAAALARALAARSLRAHVAGLGVMALTVGATAWPFVIQRASSTPELLQRWGMYRVDRLTALGWIQYAPAAGPILAAFAIVLVTVLLRERRALTTSVADALRFWLTFVVLAWIAMPIFFAILGQGLYPYMFPDRIRRISMYALAIVGWSGAHALAGTALTLRGPLARALAQGVLVVAMMAGVGARALQNAREERHTRTSFYEHPGMPPYRQEFAALVRELESGRILAGVEVLATVDQQVHVYWQMSRREARAFVPDAFVSLSTDAEMERRLVLFAKLVGFEEERFVDLVKSPGYNTMFLGVSKYATNSAHTLAPLSDYEPDEVAQIQRRNLFVGFHPFVPRSEIARLREVFRRTPALGSDPAHEPRVDAVILTNEERWVKAAPPSESFQLVYENSVFRVYRRR